MIPLEDLDNLHECLPLEPDDDLLNELLDVFNEDFVNNPFRVKGLDIKVVLSNSKVRDFENYPETFIHLVTRKNNVGRRVFDPFRATKIHWIKNILLQNECDEIKYFEFEEGDGTIRDYYWYRDKDFLVIMEKINPDYIVITSFNIDDDYQRRRYQKRFERYEQK